MSPARLRILGFVVAIASFIGCGDSGTIDCPDGELECDGVCIEIEPNLPSIQAKVFDVSCTASTCHDASNPQQGLELSSVEVSRANLVEVPSEQRPGLLRVMPFDADASYLMDKIDGVNLAPDTDRMPVGGVLCDARADAIREWIEMGAP